jgi:hypothetical protein
VKKKYLNLFETNKIHGFFFLGPDNANSQSSNILDTVSVCDMCLGINQLHHVGVSKINKSGWKFGLHMASHNMHIEARLLRNMEYNNLPFYIFLDEVDSYFS